MLLKNGTSCTIVAFKTRVNVRTGTEGWTEWGIYSNSWNVGSVLKVVQRFARLNDCNWLSFDRQILTSLIDNMFGKIAALYHI